MTADHNGADDGFYGPSRHAQPFPYWDRRRLIGEWDVDESVERIVNYKWAEEQLSAALGGWGVGGAFSTAPGATAWADTVL